MLSEEKRYSSVKKEEVYEFVQEQFPSMGCCCAESFSYKENFVSRPLSWISYTDWNLY